MAILPRGSIGAKLGIVAVHRCAKKVSINSPIAFLCATARGSDRHRNGVEMPLGKSTGRTFGHSLLPSPFIVMVRSRPLARAWVVDDGSRKTRYSLRMLRPPTEVVALDAEVWPI